MTTTSSVLQRFGDEKTVLLTTFRRNGEGVGTPIHLVVDGDRALFRTYDKAGKVKRLRNNPTVELAPSTFKGQPTGPAIRATVRPIEGPDTRKAARALAHDHKFMQGIAVPLAHRLMRYRTLYYELVPELP